MKGAIILIFLISISCQKLGEIAERTREESQRNDWRVPIKQCEELGLQPVLVFKSTGCGESKHGIECTKRKREK